MDTGHHERTEDHDSADPEFDQWLVGIHRASLDEMRAFLAAVPGLSPRAVRARAAAHDRRRAAGQAHAEDICTNL